MNAKMKIEKLIEKLNEVLNEDENVKN